MYFCRPTGNTFECPHCGELVQELFVSMGCKTMKLVPQCKCLSESQAKWFQAMKEQERKRRIEDTFPTWALGGRLDDCTFDTFELRPGTEKGLKAAKELVNKFPNTDGRGIMFTGPCGSGKTHLAAAITHEVKAKGYAVVFASVPEILDRIRATFDQQAQETERQIMFALTEARLVVLDDLGTENSTGWVREKLYTIIDSRYRKRLTTIVTTNALVHELKEDLGPRTVDRLVEMCRWVPVTADSYRLLRAAGEGFDE